MGSVNSVSGELQNGSIAEPIPGRGGDVAVVSVVVVNVCDVAILKRQ
jgi:hypothetical protein